MHVRTILLGILLSASGAVSSAESLSAGTVIVANAADADSVALAGFYRELRGIPERNVILLELPSSETIDWREFVSAVYRPLDRALVEQGWMRTLPSDLVDAASRPRRVVLGHDIAYLVLMRGVPLRIRHEPGLLPARTAARLDSRFRTNEASLDSELALIALSNTPVNGFYPNPLFRRAMGNPAARDSVVKVFRIDGPDPERIRTNLRAAATTERRGLTGRAYIDLSGPHGDGDRWLRRATELLHADDWPVVEHAGQGTFPRSVRFDAVAVYLGWYAPNVDGPFLAPGMRLNPGAVAVHIHSASATTLRRADGSWCAGLVDRGAAVTLGNVHEPYLQLTPHLDIFMEELMRGEKFGDAYYSAVPVLSWQSVAIGDPHYRPFAVPFTVQWENRKDFPPELRPYLALRQAKRLVAAGRSDRAASMLREEFFEVRSVVTGLALAEALLATGDRDGFVEALGFLEDIDEFGWPDILIARDAAKRLQVEGFPDRAARLLSRIGPELVRMEAASE